MKTLLIDNYDSYTFNLYQFMAEINGEEPIVIRNDQMSWSSVKELTFDNIVISPGPGRPDRENDFGICRQSLLEIRVPILGVCLGHQGLGHFYGGQIIHAPQVMHGRLSHIYHNNSSLFKGIPQAFSVVRYHSLIISDQLPEDLEKIAWTQDGLVMGLRHRTLPLWGVQFHPESICTEYGKHLLKNWRDISQQFLNKNLVSKHQNPFRRHLIHQKLAHPYLNRTNEEISKYQVSIRKLDFLPNVEQTFIHLYSEDENAFWLDSSQVTEGLSRFSFIGGSNGPHSKVIQYHTQTKTLSIKHHSSIVSLKKSIFDYLKDEINDLRCQSEELPFDFNCGFVGYFGYELKVECGAKNNKHVSSIPDAIFLLADRIIVFDHQEQMTYLMCLTKKGQSSQAEVWFEAIMQTLRALPPLHSPKLGHQTEQITFRFSRSYQTYLDNIQQCLHEITEGESYEICLTNKIHTNVHVNSLTLYRTLRKTNPAPYAAFLRFGDIAILSTSPERFLKIDQKGWVETKPIKGTVARGKTSEEDIALREHLANNIKDRAENLMIVDLLRNDLGQVCEIGSIQVSKLMDVETYATVHQLVSTIGGQLRQNLTAIDCIRATFPGGSMTGAPKIRTMEIIESLEQEARGVYSGTIGFLSLNGAADFNIVIRTAVVTPTETSIGVGGAIVALSDPQVEYDEILLKAQALIRAILITVSGDFNPNQ